MTHVDAFRISVNPLSRRSSPARLDGLARPAMQGLMLAAFMLLLAGTAQAAGSSMPWEGPLQSILESIQGPVARIVAVIIIIATGLALAFGDTSGGFRKLIQTEDDLDQLAEAAASVAECQSKTGCDNDDDGDDLGDRAFDTLQNLLQRFFPRHGGAGSVGGCRHQQRDGHNRHQRHPVDKAAAETAKGGRYGQGKRVHASSPFGRGWRSEGS